MSETRPDFCDMWINAINKMGEKRREEKQSRILENSATVHTYACDICPGCGCTRTVKVIGPIEPTIRQVCSTFPSMDNHTEWRKLS